MKAPASMGNRAGCTRMIGNPSDNFSIIFLRKEQAFKGQVWNKHIFKVYLCVREERPKRLPEG